MQGIAVASFREDSMKHLLWIIPIIFVISTPSSIHACCGVGFGLGQRLAPMEDAALHFSFGSTDRFASWTHEQKVSPLPPTSYEQSIRLETSGTLRITRMWQFGLTIPNIYNSRSYGTTQSSSAEFGDISATIRHEILPLAGAGRPLALALPLTVITPTGLPAAQSKDPLGTDITGLGTWEIRPGITTESISKSGWYLSASLAIGIRIPHKEHEKTVRLSPRIYGIAMVGKTIGHEGSLSAGLLYETEGAVHVDGHRVTGGGRSRTAVTTVGTIPIADMTWITGSLSSDLPFTNLGRNEAITRTITIGLRIAFLLHTKNNEYQTHICLSLCLHSSLQHKLRTSANTITIRRNLRCFQ